MNCFLLCLVLGLTLQVSRSTTVYSSTSTAGSLIAFQLKTICTCQFKGLSDSTTVACDQIYYLNILNAYLFDSPTATATNDSTCVAKTSQTSIIGSVTDAIDTYCYDFGTNNNCSITDSFLINLFQASGSSVNKVKCLSIDIFYSCVISSTTSADTPSSSSATSYNMTYFFYIITLILSSSCILIGVGLILRRVLLHRSARDGYPGTTGPWSRRRHNQFATSTTSGTTNQGFVGPPPPDGLWTMPYPNHAMVYPPPSYDRINESPQALNVPPPYDAAAMILGQKKEEEIIMSMTELTNRVVDNNTSATTTTVNQTESTNNTVSPVQDNTSEQNSDSNNNNNNNNTGNQIA